MRKLMTVSLAALTISLGAPSGLAAQVTKSSPAAPALSSSISGQVVDAGGRGVARQRVELVQNGVVLHTTTTGAAGEFSFASVVSGEYIVRVAVNGLPAGIRVPVTPGAAVTGATIVLPSAAAPSGISKKMGITLGVIGAGITAAIIIVTTVS